MDFVVIIQSFLHKDRKISYDLIPKTNKNRLGVVIFVILGGVPYLSLYAAVQYVCANGRYSSFVSLVSNPCLRHCQSGLETSIYNFEGST